MKPGTCEKKCGSSPRGRGKLPVGAITRALPRLIPARAGKTGEPAHPRTHGPAHPRAGGENIKAAVSVVVEWGSSPRGRGKRARFVRRIARARLIPARAGKTHHGDRGSAAHQAHPRAGGENLMNPWMRFLPAGSSPRGRGKLLLRCRQRATLRLIPARAGKTPPRARLGRLSWAHPRAGGENFRRVGDAGLRPGSSPRGRGKRRKNQFSLPSPGLIPARAGKTRGLFAWLYRRWAHPRAGGENLLNCTARLLGGGSSPRGRGKRLETEYVAGPRRLIPARAGKTRWRAWSRDSGGAHPRAGGENAVLIDDTSTFGGSSPRGRGKPSPTVASSGHVRLIPARAGKTPSIPTSLRCSRAHPRAGGENPMPIGDTCQLKGSSPRGRGKPAGRSVADHRGGLIPARAGKTLAIRTGGLSGWAHPRAGGENHRRSAPNGIKNGSSPRGRGKRADRRLDADLRRLIPARAGKTRVATASARASWAHPRAGGENAARAVAARVGGGSSPRGRGKLHPKTGKPLDDGLIPARAGKTRRSRRISPSSGAHPRAGGEN